MKSKKYLIYAIFGLLLSIENVIIILMRKRVTINGIFCLLFGILLIFIYFPATFNKQSFLDMKLEEEDECNIVKNYRTVMIVDNIMDWIIFIICILGICIFLLSGQRNIFLISISLFSGMYIGLKAIIGVIVSFFVKPELK